MAGINRALSINESRAKVNFSANVKCVFISHQKNDTAYSKKIADYIMDSGIDVYFDEYDKDLRIYRQTNNPNGIVNCIKRGINTSSHMLCIISINTLDSKWVPWELGYGYDKTSQGVLTLKGINENQLPDYLKTTNIIRGTKSLNSFIQNIADNYSMILESHTKSLHSLDSVLDWNL